MGTVTSFVTTSNQDALTLLEEDISENKFESTLKLQEPGLKSTDLSDNNSDMTLEGNYN